MGRKGTIGLIIAGAVFLLISIVYTIIRNGNREEKDLAIEVQSKKRTNGGFFLAVFKFCKNFPLTKKMCMSVFTQVSKIRPGNIPAARQETGKILTSALAKTVIAFIFGIIINFPLGYFDAFFLCATIFAGVILAKVDIRGKLLTLDEQLTKEENEGISEVRHNYHILPRVDTAINKSIPHIGKIIGAHFSEIHKMLVSSNRDELMNKYIASNPDRFLLMFLSICAATKEYGDETLENGQSLFTMNLAYLKEEIENKLLEINLKKTLFKGATLVTLIPLVAIKPLEIWAGKSFPMVAQYYTGLYATASIVATFVVTYIIYTMSCIIQDGGTDTGTKESDIFSKLATNEILAPYLTRHIKKKYTKYSKIDSELRGIGDHTGARAFILRRIAFAIAGFAITLAVFFVGIYSGKSKLLTDFAKDFENSATASEDYKKTMRETAALIVSQGLYDSDATPKSFAEIVRRESGLTEAGSTEVADAIIAHMKEYNSRYFRWWELIIAFAVGIAFSFEPVLILRLNKPVIEAKRQEEVMQFQTLMLILMHMPSTSVADILSWMERFSSCFKEGIIKCKANLGSGIEAALTEMKENEPFIPFKNFCDNLLAVDAMGVAEAFDEVQAEHEYYIETKKRSKETSLKSGAEKVSRLGMFPFYAVMILYLLIPLFKYVGSMFKEFGSFL